MRRVLSIIYIVILLSACSSTPPKSDPKHEYYRGVWDSCLYAAVERNESNPSETCAPVLKTAISEDWYTLNSPNMPFNP